ncbi:LuxR C-terminal-related transcriptional regulator [Ktedonospora formicarum]|uniref:LuxR family transcriptional regulator n=1 Tax=Ktedonospora formicarum TaxID=2778364 RepID=A0A8J3I686_9CHLR|nr:LuxR C-terminal-related transcriptional regulator [Ktedonospora formicarum]GHO47858.1 LuxR family transcriptional regulator [Ktedonospora formicarum]
MSEVVKCKKPESNRLASLPLLTSKLQPPRLASGLIERKRLLISIDRALESRLTLISAPAGSGKTTLVRQWMEGQRAQGQLSPIAWVTLDIDDNDPLHFWRYVAHACLGLPSQPGRDALSQLDAMSSPFKPLPLEGLITTLLNELSQISEPGLLVLDDYHIIDTPQIHESLNFFIEHLPPDLHLILITRADPPFALARFRVRGELIELYSADLRFTQEEAQAFLSLGAINVPSPEMIQQLYNRLEGWPAGLRLLSLALQRCRDQREIASVVSSFTGSQSALQEYFVSEILSVQPEPLQDFLLRTSVLARLTGPLCDALVERVESDRVLTTLAHANLFLEPLADGEGWYRYHALFAEAMQAEARKRLGNETLRALALKASEWYEARELLSEAIEAAFQAQDMQRVIGLLERLTQHQTLGTELIPTRGTLGPQALRRWLERLPEPLLHQHPALCLRYATTLLNIIVTAQTSVTATIFEHIHTLLDIAEEGWRRDQDTEGLGSVFAFRALLARQRGDLERGMDWARQALAYLPEEDMAWRHMCHIVVGIGAIFLGNLHDALQAIERNREYCRAFNLPPIMRANTVLLSGVLTDMGALHRASEHLQYILHEAREQQDLDDIGDALVGLAGLSYEWNTLEEAEKQAREALDIGRTLQNMEFQVQSVLVLAQIEQIRGDTRSALEWLETPNLQAQPSYPLFTQLERSIQTTQASIHLASGNLSAVQRWLDERAQVRIKLPCLQRDREELLVARWFLAQEPNGEALQHLKGLEEAAREGGRMRHALEARLLSALAYAAEKRVQEARHALLEVLARAHIEGYTRLFLDEGEVMATLLRSVLPHLHAKAQVSYVQGLLAVFEREQTGSAPLTIPASPLLEPLSPQELRVLRLLVAGHTNPEIARELVVSVNTVKAQVQSIYRKLDVNNRVEASKVASLLNLL